MRIAQRGSNTLDFSFEGRGEKGEGESYRYRVGGEEADLRLKAWGLRLVEKPMRRRWPVQSASDIAPVPLFLALPNDDFRSRAR